MKLKWSALSLLSLMLLLIACNNSPVVEDTISNVQTQIEPIALPPATIHETLVDEQGAVSVAVTPLNLEEAGADTLTFEVVMDTHSVDLSMDLANLTTLTMDNGDEIMAVLWDAQAGGHHVSGILSFPAPVNDTTLLTGASQLTMTIHNVDAPERVFTWQLGK